MVAESSIKCRKCGEILFQSSVSVILNAHHSPKDNAVEDSVCQSLSDRSFVYIDENENTLPTFVNQQVQQVSLYF